MGWYFCSDYIYLLFINSHNDKFLKRIVINSSNPLFFVNYNVSQKDSMICLSKYQMDKFLEFIL